MNCRESRSKVWIGLPPMPDVVAVGPSGGSAAPRAQAESNLQLVNWVARAAEEPHAFVSPGREHLVDQARESLVAGQSVLLVGGAGSGKTQIAKAIAGKFAESDALNEAAANHSVFALDKNSFIGGQCNVGDVSKRVTAILAAVAAARPAYVFLDEIHSLIGAGAHRHNAADIFQQLKPHISDGTFPVIGATTPEEVAPFLADRALTDRFTVIQVPAIPDGQIRAMLPRNPAVIKLMRDNDVAAISDAAFDEALDIAVQSPRFMHMTRMRACMAVLRSAIGKAITAMIDRGEDPVVAELTAEMVRAVQH